MSDEVEVEEVEEHKVNEFDRGTVIRVMNDGSLRLKLPLMPPSWGHVGFPYDCFEDTLAKALGVEVEGLDKEFFGVQKPLPDTIPKLKALLLELRNKHEKR